MLYSMLHGTYIAGRRPGCSTLHSVPDEKDRASQPYSPVQCGDQGPDFVIADVVEEIAAEDQKSEDSGHGCAGPSPLFVLPQLGDMNAPQEAEHPDCGKCKCTVEFEPPGFEWIRHGAKVSLLDEVIVEEEPETTR